MPALSLATSQPDAAKMCGFDSCSGAGEPGPPAAAAALAALLAAAAAAAAALAGAAAASEADAAAVLLVVLLVVVQSAMAMALKHLSLHFWKSPGCLSFV